MLERIADWLDRQPPGRRRLYSVFIALALLTLPCYAAGAALWALNVPGGGAPMVGEPEASATAAEAAPTALPTAAPAPVEDLGDEDEDEPQAPSAVAPTEAPPLAPTAAPTTPSPWPRPPS